MPAQAYISGLNLTSLTTASILYSTECGLLDAPLNSFHGGYQPVLPFSYSVFWIGIRVMLTSKTRPLKVVCVCFNKRATVSSLLESLRAWVFFGKRVSWHIWDLCSSRALHGVPFVFFSELWWWVNYDAMRRFKGGEGMGKRWRPEQGALFVDYLYIYQLGPKGQEGSGGEGSLAESPLNQQSQCLLWRQQDVC